MLILILILIFLLTLILFIINNIYLVVLISNKFTNH